MTEPLTAAGRQHAASYGHADWVMEIERQAIDLERDAARKASPPLDVERLRLVYHARYEADTTSYWGCRHLNQHRSTWNCALAADELAAEYAALDPTP